MRLIDADMAREDMLFEMCGTGYQYNAMSVIDRQPTVDAVEVVRCCECKYYGYVLTCGCSRIETSEYGIAIMKPDDFCSYGERKEASE